MDRKRAKNERLVCMTIWRCGSTDLNRRCLNGQRAPPRRVVMFQPAGNHMVPPLFLSHSNRVATHMALAGQCLCHGGWEGAGAHPSPACRALQ